MRFNTTKKTTGYTIHYDTKVLQYCAWEIPSALLYIIPSKYIYFKQPQGLLTA
jgi:hypothetical protein